ncbi:prealbumin-like fold domain-containing protein [bacterium]|nr:prealbumin-like fold domain-containing protein [bacterium]
MSSQTRGMVPLRICRETAAGECVPATGPQRISILRGSVVVFEVVTDANGYVIANLPPGSYTLLVNGGCPTPLTVTQPGQEVRVCSKCAT